MGWRGEEGDALEAHKINATNPQSLNLVSTKLWKERDERRSLFFS
jgi:hypothetical protein